MALFFGGNPFATAVGKKIEQATDASLPSENWTLNMEICDMINETEDGPKDAMKAFRKRLNMNVNRNFTTVMYTLTVLETCVKNCHQKFLILVCSKEFIQELVKLIGPKNDPPAQVQEKVLCLIQCWADAFKDQSELNGVVQVYNELKQKGIEFPAISSDMMPLIFTPQRNAMENGGTISTSISANSNVSNSSVTLTPEQLVKLTSELRVVEGNMTVLSEMLSEIVPGEEPPKDLELLKELYTTCQAMQERLVELISQLSNDEITAELLRVNDGLNNLFLRYSRYEKNKKSISTEKENNEGSLIDLTDNGHASVNYVNSQLSSLTLNATTASNQLHSIPSVTAYNQKKDEFEKFVQARNASSETCKTDSSETNREVPNLVSNSGTVKSQPSEQVSNTFLPVPDLIGMHLEQDFDEMAAWLGEKHEESLTSSEFEKFLAERAAAAEALPTSGENNPTNKPPREQNKDSMFIL